MSRGGRGTSVRECHPSLFGDDLVGPACSPTVGASLTTVDEGSRSPLGPVDCAVGCRGTTECLCGQGELSDFPLWVEND